MFRWLKRLLRPELTVVVGNGWLILPPGVRAVTASLREVDGRSCWRCDGTGMAWEYVPFIRQNAWVFCPSCHICRWCKQVIKPGSKHGVRGEHGLLCSWEPEDA